MLRQKSDDDCLWTAFKKEFRLENFSLNFEKNSQFLKEEPEVVLEYFHTTIWPCLNRLVYVIYRIAIAFYYTIWFIESIIRNAEFIAKGIKIKNKINMFSMHPWPLYMTSWSLTILFVHLWLAAFISLYFYSINEKSCLSDLFSYLFGPFSCSRSFEATTTSKPAKSTKNDSFSGKFQKIISKTSAKESTKHSMATSAENSEPTKLNLLNMTSQMGQIKMGSTTTRDLENTNQIIFFSQDQQNLDATCKSVTRISPHRTYCDNQSLCNIPSSVVISNANSWKLWINAHVPNLILVLIKVSWLLNNLVAISALIVTCIYFGYAYIVDLEDEPTWAHELGNVHRHGINSIVALIDVLLLGYPIRILHFIYVIVYGWVYAAVTFLYWFQNPKEHVIYDQIDYKNPLKMAFGYGFLTILVFLMQITHFLAYRLKVLIKDKYFDKNCICVSTKIETPVSNDTEVNINSDACNITDVTNLDFKV